MPAQLNKKYIRTSKKKTITRLISYIFFEGRPLTTKGRWINPFILWFLKVAKKFPQTKEIKKPIFIIGSGRSGTTILGMILSIHSKIGFLNEPKALWYTINSSDDIIGSYSLIPGKYYFNTFDVDQNVIHRAYRLYSFYLLLSRAQRVLDKYPEMVFRIPFLKSIFPDAKFIFLVRNGRDTCRSIDNWSKKNWIYSNLGSHDWWGQNKQKWKLLLDQVVRNDIAFNSIYKTVSKYSTHLEMAAVEWIVIMREGLRQKEIYEGSIKIIKYEDLTIDTEKILIDIFDFCNIGLDQKVIDYAKMILKPYQNHPEFKIPSEIKPIFDATMLRLGYHKKIVYKYYV